MGRGRGRTGRRNRSFTAPNGSHGVERVLQPFDVAVAVSCLGPISANEALHFQSTSHDGFFTLTVNTLYSPFRTQPLLHTI